MRLMQAKTPAIFQATFVADSFIAKNDVLAYDATNDKWNLYEVKGTNAVKENSEGHRDHIDDIAFQLSVLRRARVAVGRCFIIHLNKEYIRSGDIDLSALFVTDDVTEKIEARLPEIEEKMEVAQGYLSSEKETGRMRVCLQSTEEALYKPALESAHTYVFSP